MQADRAQWPYKRHQWLLSEMAHPLVASHRGEIRTHLAVSPSLVLASLLFSMVNQRWLKTALAAEVPVLIVTISLLSWALYALHDAHTFVTLSSQTPSVTGEGRARYGMNLGTQIVTLTTTFTGTTALYSPVVSYRTMTSLLRYPSSTEPFTYAVGTIIRSTVGSTSGTITATKTQTLNPGRWGTAEFGDIYSQAQVSPSTLERWAPGQYENSVIWESKPDLVTLPTSAPPSSSTSPTSAASTMAAVATPAPERRDGSWSEGYTYNATQDGLYYRSWENLFELGLWLGTFASCLAMIVVRLVVNVAYICIAPRKVTAVLLLVSAVVALAVLLGCGITAWVYFITWQRLTAPEVQATFAFYLLTTLTTISVLTIAACEVHRYNKEAKFGRRPTIESVDSDAGSTAVGHQATVGNEK